MGLIELAVEVTAQVELEGPRPEARDVARYIWDWDEKMPGGFYVMRSEAVGWPPWQEFNGDGLRDRTRPREKPEGVWRVAILGAGRGDQCRPHVGRHLVGRITAKSLDAEANVVA